ncbi:MAG: extracellular solute-binding protein [Lachnospiraceae bacterium]|nr:extracellular solute-binding protein [Lachnospiraceae bacterium]
MTRKGSKAIAVAMSMVMAFGIAGCGESAAADTTQSAAETTAAESGAAETQAAESAATEEPVTLRYAWWGSDNRHEAMLAMIEAFEAKYPNITVEAEYQGYDGYYEKIMTELSSGTAPDVMQIETGWIPDIQGAGDYLADLQTLPVDLTTLKPGLLDASGMYNGEANLFPCTVGSSCVYVNTEFASAHGIDLSKVYSWDELMELGSAIHSENEDLYLMTADTDILNKLFFQPYLVQNTGVALIDEETMEMTFTEQNAADAFQMILDMYESGTLEPFGEANTFAGSMNQDQRWINGEIGAILGYTGNAPVYQDSTTAAVDVMAFPRIENAKSNGITYAGNRGAAINANSENIDTAALFVDYMMNDEEAISILGTNLGFCPTTTADKVLLADGTVGELQTKGIELAQPDSYVTNATSGNTDLATTSKDLIEEVVYGEVTPEEAAAELMEKYQEILDLLK